VEEECRLRVRRELRGLPAAEVRVEAEAALVRGLQEHHPRGWAALSISRPEGHRLGHDDAGSLRLTEPAPELSKRIVIKLAE